MFIECLLCSRYYCFNIRHYLIYFQNSPLRKIISLYHFEETKLSKVRKKLMYDQSSFQTLRLRSEPRKSDSNGYALFHSTRLPQKKI